MRVENKLSLIFLYLPVNAENDDTVSILTERLMPLGQTAQMLAFCRQTRALKAISPLLDGLGSSVTVAL